MAGMRRDANGFTPMQAAIMEVLGDGEWHSRDVLMRVIDNDRNVLVGHIADIRRALKPKGLLIFYSLSNTNGPGYQLARKLSPMSVG